MGYVALRGELGSCGPKAFFGEQGLLLDALLRGIFQETQDWQEQMLVRMGRGGHCSRRVTSRRLEHKSGKKQSPPSVGRTPWPKGDSLLDLCLGAWKGTLPSLCGH